MKQAITLTAVAAAAVAAGATAPNTADAAVPVSHAQIGTVESSAQIASRQGHTWRCPCSHAISGDGFAKIAAQRCDCEQQT